jgi:PhnB protein
MKHHDQTSKDIGTSVAPLLSVRRGARAIDFYKPALGAEELLRIENDKGEVVARMAVDGAEFWLADESPEHLNFSPESLGGGSVRMVLTVQNPDAAFERAIAAGATVVWPVADQHYGWRVGRIVDPFGHHWEIGKPLSNCAEEPK